MFRRGTPFQTTRSTVADPELRFLGHFDSEQEKEESFFCEAKGEEKFFSKSTRVTSGNLRMTLAVDFSIKLGTTFQDHKLPAPKKKVIVSFSGDPDFRAFSEKDKVCS